MNSEQFSRINKYSFCAIQLLLWEITYPLKKKLNCASAVIQYLHIDEHGVHDVAQWNWSMDGKR